MEKWARIKYMPCLSLGDNNSRITGSRRHIELSKEVAGEGIVLLKNEGGLLPLPQDTRLAVFGKAQIDYVKGGGGSGNVFCEYIRNIYEGLKNTGKLKLFDKLSLYYEGYVREMYQKGEKAGLFDETDIPEELVKEARRFTDTAVITISRYSGEGWDRKNDGTDKYFDLSEKESAMVEAVTNNFDKVIVLINSGAMIETGWFADNSKIQAALMIWQGGMEGATVAAEVLTGDIVPSGKLTDTFAKSLSDYPSTAGFHENDYYVKYTEDIFVGYRYFETVPGKKDRVVYPFGYGLSYTSFEISRINAVEAEGRIYVSATVKNTGKYSGKEVVQLYYAAPRGKLTKAATELCAFKKTKLLPPGESEVVTLDFPVDDMASYDDMGAVCESAYVMERGSYRLFLGNSVRNVTELEYKHKEQKTRVVKQLTSYCAPEKLEKRLNADGSYTGLAVGKRRHKKFPCRYKCPKRIPENEEDIKKLIDVYNGELTLDKFMTQLTDEELMSLVSSIPSRGVSNTGGIGGIEKYGIPAPMTEDGPAGVRIFPHTGVRTTAFPIASMIACTWNTELCEAVGRAGALEIKENNLSIWLTPALNIHRSPLCGRNFEYYSEDPFVSGKMAAAMVRGIQSQGIVATPKHFACNNKETKRAHSDSILSERALREIYLKGFEICVKEAKPKALMTSYNILNGVYASENAELICGILRGEWGFDGAVMSDWNNPASHFRELCAGNDIRMPYYAVSDLKAAYERGRLKRNKIAESAKRTLELILSFE